MHNIIIDKPYRFVPPRPGNFWPAMFRRYLPSYLRKTHGVESWELTGSELLKASLEAGHGIMLAPNHCRPCDPFVLGSLCGAVARNFYIMASWHLFMQSRFQAWLLPRVGVFSVYREGMDREALRFAIQILTEAQRPLVVFPEGFITRSNDRLNHLMEGPSFMARTAAKQRATANPPGKVVIHPIALRYFFRGDLAGSINPVLEQIENRLSWRAVPNKPMIERIRRIGQALLALKELEYFGQAQSGTLDQRLAGLIDRLLSPLEKEWQKEKREGDTFARVKALRSAILPDLVSGEISEEERARRWKQLADIYVAQQTFCYPPDYLNHSPTTEQILETVERFEEDLTGTTRVHRPIHAVIEVGEALEVSPGRERGAATDPLMVRLRERLEAMLANSRSQRPLAPSEEKGGQAFQST